MLLLLLTELMRVPLLAVQAGVPIVVVASVNPELPLDVLVLVVVVVTGLMR